MSRGGMWLRWSWRDLRRRWALVGTIALVIALGTGTYAGLLSTSEWRERSNDESFALLHTHDLRVALPPGSTIGQGRLLALLDDLPDAARVTGARERLVVPTQVAGPRNLLVTGEMVGADTRGRAVDGVDVSSGRAPTPGEDAVVAELGFADANSLGPGSRLTVSGGTRLDVVGRGQSPEYFVLTGGQGGLPFLTQESYGVLFGTLDTVQRAAGLRGQVNDLVLTLAPGTDTEDVRRQLEAAVAAARPPIAADVTTRADIDAHRILYEDIEGDEQFWQIIALLMLLGATVASFNLTTRVVEASRREIGIGMAIGVPVRLLALRPLMFGAQIALLGVVLGLAVGGILTVPLRAVFTDLLPLPVWRTPLQLDVFLQAALLGFLLPFAAIAWPVWRALRVQPVEAIRIGHLAARGGGLAPLARRLRLPGPGYRQMPLRNVLRTPRRSTLTALGIATAIATLVTMVGFLDSFGSTLDRSEREVLHAAPDRVEVALDGFWPEHGGVVTAVERLPEVGQVERDLVLPVEAESGGHTVEMTARVLADGAVWTPTLVEGRRTGGLVLAEEAARDLGVGVGDTVQLRHPRATTAGLETVRTDVEVVGTHPNPMRVFAYLDARSASLFGMAGTTNSLVVTPAEGVTPDEVRRALLGVPHVTAAQTPASTVEGMRATLDQFVDVIRVSAVVALLLALLIAFNTTSIAVDERSREHATMLAYGLPASTVVGLTAVETVLIGTLGTLGGLLGGYGLLGWLVERTVPNVMPEVGVTATLAWSTLAGALALGVLTVALAPLLTVRRVRSMDVPSALRVIE
jgi:putative ABC transport system permease protein